MSRALQRRLQLFAVGLLAASVLTACTVSMEGGIIGGGISLLLAALLFLGVGVTQSGCDPEEADPEPEIDAEIGPCLQPPFDAELGPCLSAPLHDMGSEIPDAEIGPCLSAPAPDMGPEIPDAEIGPCLQPPLPDMGPLEPDAELGPCLSAPPPDMGPEIPDAEIGPCLDVPPDDASLPDAELGPCLSPPPPPPDEKHGQAIPEQPSPERATAKAGGREAVIERVLATRSLPPDVAARLQRKPGGEG